MRIMKNSLYLFQIEKDNYIYYKNMNLNSSTNKGDFQLRQAVEEQLDLILKMEQERKALKKQNRMLYQKLKQTNQLMSKYGKQTKQISTQTQKESQICEDYKKQNKIIKNQTQSKSQPIKISKSEDYGIQVQLEPTHTNSSEMNFSKLSQAQNLLKILQSSQIQQKVEQLDENKKNMKKQNGKIKGKVSQEQATSQDKNIASQMIKITKQLNLYKKQLKQMEHKYILRDKEIKDLKKCIQNKNQALEKSRKQFNQLSILMNTQKYKSIKSLQQEIQNLKLKISQGEQDKDSLKVKKLLSGLTIEYEQYRKQTDKKINALINQLANKQKELSIARMNTKKQTNKF